ncbi:toll/interleukin-1 receptor domain-containing protein [Amycolatopsis minnesotensis]|uniref:SEFIR domain-containing protein n=1 Tax=Amycolatopsis minnesotensis TaxID=337894 RepID=A0ABN2SNI6_9PSEU
MSFQESQPDRLPGGNPTVFVSYTHDDEQHRRAVREFASFLQDNGVDVVLDQWAEDHRKDWQAWAQKGMTESDYVIVVASDGYRRMGDGNGPNDRNLGGQSEAALLRDLLQGDRRAWTPKILPVLLPGQGIEGIPLFLQPHAADRYAVDAFTPAGAEDLIRTVTRQPRHVRPPLGRTLVLPPESGPGARTEATWTTLPEAIPVHWLPDLVPGHRHRLQPAVELHLVPVEPTARLGIRQLETVRGELASAGRSRRLFSPSEGLTVESSDQAVWAYASSPATVGSGLAVHRSGQRTCWFPATQATLGWLLDRNDLTEQLTDHLGLLADLEIPLPGKFAPTIGMAPTGSVRVGDLSDAAATTASFPVGQPQQVRFDADEAVAVADLRGSARSIAEELAARLTTALAG